MFKRIQIQNFRILSRLNLSDLHRINLITGLNSCGKTSFLEAVFLLSGAANAQLFMNSYIMRSLIPSVGTRARSENSWRVIFSDLNLFQAIEIMGDHQELGELKLEIKSVLEEIQIRQNGSDSTSNNFGNLRQTAATVINKLTVPTLNLRYFQNSTIQTESNIRLDTQGAEISQPIANPSFNAAYVSSHTGSHEEDANRLGLLKRKKLGDHILRALIAIEPRLLSVEESSECGVSLIYGDVGLGELIPLSIMGNGISWVARLILAISSVPGGVVLVDKIESGFHHAVLPKVWKAIDEATSTFNVQLISTTQSRENIEAAHGVLDPGAFRLHRLESNGKTNQCVTYVPESIGAAMEHGIEVR